ncbi:hypothetical protein BDP27DRAFT_1316402 [Rhodocollybia butyracea]|uniref:Uncharacterized protein n=1 Tax=Rhodocollybia butyracea TaxID=206335 RepID=A0A9P5PZ01_9AGAR|nr:hypothetical protein BDP27DRAFT_1316402 [Rhodocollybia butyracea]
MSSRFYAYSSDSHTQQYSPTQHPVLPANYSDAVDEHSVGYSYGAQGFARDQLKSNESYPYPNVTQPILNESSYDDFRHGYSEPVNSHHPVPPSVRTSFQTSNAIYSQFPPQVEMQATSSSPPSFLPTAQYHYESLSYPRVVEDHSNLTQAFTPGDIIMGDEEPYYDDNYCNSSGGMWMPENKTPSTDTWPDSPVVAGTEELDVWTKMQYPYAQPPPEGLFQQWYHGIGAQDSSGYYPSYPTGVDSSLYSTHLSADMRNTPSDFTSSESPLSPLDIETYQSNVASTTSPDTSLFPLPAFTASSVLPALPIIHAPRPTRTIDSAYFERLISGSRVSPNA